MQWLFDLATIKSEVKQQQKEEKQKQKDNNSIMHDVKTYYNCNYRLPL